MANIQHTFEALRDKVLVEQFLLTCSTKLTIFLRERECQSLQEVASKADLFLEAQAQPTTSKSKIDETNKQSSVALADKSKTGGGRKALRCFLCNKIGHKAENCHGRPPASKGITCWQCGKTGHRADSCRSKPNDNHQASCLWTTSRNGEVTEPEDGFVTLKNGDKIPVVNSAVGHPPKCLVENLPVVEGDMGGQKITVLRDTGCNTVVVRQSLVPKEAYTGILSPVFLLDKTVRHLPEAEIMVRTPYYTGKLTAKCVNDPLYDLVLGNVPLVRDANDPDPNWSLNVKMRKAHMSATEPADEQKTGTEGVLAKETHVESLERSADESLLERGDKEFMGTAGAVQTKKPACRPPPSPPGLRVPEVPLLQTTKEELIQEQKNDETLKKCFHDVGKVTKKHRGRTKYEFFIRNELLYRSCTYSSGRKTDQLVLPKKFRRTVTGMAHDGIMSGHQGVSNTIALLSEEFFWPGVQSDIKRYVRSCDICQRTVPKGRVGKAPLGTMPTIVTPFQRVAIDIIGPIAPKSDSGNRYILTMVDVATRYPDAVALKTIGTPVVAEALVGMFTRYGVPREVLSDRGSAFTSDLMKEVGRLLSVRRLLTTPYHPMSNGLVEKFNGTLKLMLRRMCQERPKDWDRYLPALLFAYREVPQSSLRFSPFELLYGRTVRGPLTILREVWSNEALNEETKTSYSYVMELRDKLEETCKLAHQCLDEAKVKYKAYYDRKKVTREMKVGDKALILLPSDNNKLLMQWKGPFIVTARRNEVDYELEIAGTRKAFHVNMLKKYEERTEMDPAAPRCSAATATDDDNKNDEEDAIDDVPTLSLTRQQNGQDVLVNTTLSTEEKKQVATLIGEFGEIFSDLPGKTNLIECDLKLTTQAPVHVKQYPLPIKFFTHDFIWYFAREREMKELCYIGGGQECRLVLRVRVLRERMRSLPGLEIAQAKSECCASAGRNYRQSETLAMNFKIDGVEEVQR
ncbi:uncharacterized protein LOC120841708 [Ixodes scapularis]|uniref:uncharacterized protein LOC120841708 n=1 Tax=Ixodes scapularis TaxID=6945 RepID=UPI001A9F3B6E|nr:uncharacterized protein LOC120841708 [Ixodes scapularis]